MQVEEKLTKTHLVYGAPGSGKTTVCEQVCKERDIPYVSIGAMTRAEVSAGTDLGKRLKYYLDIPLEYPKELIAELVETRLKDLIGKVPVIILDGYPKYDWEADDFLKFLDKNPYFKIGLILIIDIPLEVALARIERRFICKSCSTQTSLEKEDDKHVCPHCGGELIKREDDNEDFIRQRYLDYHAAIDPTLEVLNGNYDSKVIINGEMTIEQIILEIKRYLEA